jgi:plastocyanin
MMNKRLIESAVITGRQVTMSRKQYHTFYFSLAACLMNLCLCLPPFASARAQGSNATVQILGSLQPPGFFPALLTVHVNDYITFVNQSSPPATFTIASDNGQFSSPALSPGKMWTIALSNPGAYEFHDATTSPRMVGEVIVVPDAISLLPTPEPGVAATALALIEAGKTPPDNLALVTPTPGAIRSLSSPSGNSMLINILMLVSVGLLFLALLIAVILLVRRVRRRRHQRREPKEQDINTIPALPITAPRQRLLARLWQRRGEDEDDLEDDDDEEI